MPITHDLISKNAVLVFKKTGTVIFFIAVFIFLAIESSNKGDFHIFLEASQSLFKGENIYEINFFDGYHYFYSILFAILIYPFTFLPAHVAVFLWLCFNVLFLYRSYVTLSKLLPLHSLSEKYRRWFWILTIVFSARLILENLHVGQITILLLWLCLEGVRLINNKRVYNGAFLIALGINIKLLPIVVLPYLLYRKQFKAAGLITLFTATLLFIPLFVIDQDEFETLMTTWINLINPLKTKHMLDVEERSFHSITTLLSTLFIKNVPDIYALDIRRHVTDVSIETLSTIITCTRLALISFTLYFIRSKPLKKANGSLHRFWEFSYILCLIPLIFPHQQHYAFLFIVPAFSYCIYYVLKYQHELSAQRQIVVVVFLSIIYLSVNLKLILGAYNEYYEHFKILTYGALLLIIPLSVLLPPKVLNNS